MKKHFHILVCIALFCLCTSIASSSDDAYSIMLKHHNVYEGDDSKSLMKMELINKSGKRRLREVVVWTLERGEEDKSLMVFTAPASDKGTAFLTWEHKDKNDDQWLYLPVLKKVKRISAAEKHKSFMGTDFSYNDLAPPHPQKFIHKLKGEDVIDGQACYLIESIHKTHTNDPAYQNQRKYQYTKQQSWIRKDNNLLVKAVMFDKKGEKCKLFSAADIIKVDDIWTAMSMKMENLKNGHRTILTIREVRYNVGLTDDFFTTRELERPR